MDKKELFLKELTELSKKHKMYIGGCGCCGSPYVIDENEKDVVEDLRYDYEEEKYKGEED